MVDTLDWRGYFPLEINNEWHYTTERTPWPYDSTYISHSLIKVEGDTLDGSYFVISSDFFSRLRSNYVRYDSASAGVVEYARFADGTWREICWRSFCDIDAPFNTVNEEGWLVSSEVVPLPPGSLDLLTEPRYKTFGVEITGITFAHGIGIVGQDREGDGREFTYLVYARVGDREYGERVIFVSLEPVQKPRSSFGKVLVYPNPTYGVLMVGFGLSVPEQVKVAVYDLLGRRVYESELGYREAGVQEVELDVAGLVPGVYVMRLVNGSEGWMLGKFVRSR